MTTNSRSAAAAAEDRLWDEQIDPRRDGAAKLDELLIQVQAACRDFDFEDAPLGQPRTIEIRRGDQLFAVWTREGRTLVFTPHSGTTGNATTVNEAFDITMNYLKRVRSMIARRR